MKRWAIRVITVIQVGGCLVYGGGKVFRAAGIGGGGDDGLWDNLSTLCRISIIIWLISALIIGKFWTACQQGCKGSLSPASCESGCASLWGGLFLIETVLLGLICGATHLG